jgi:7-keto-8-aminopelargonate synthetase-like enzyme
MARVGELDVSRLEDEWKDELGRQAKSAGYTLNGKGQRVVDPKDKLKEKLGERVVFWPGNALTEDFGREQWDLIFVAHLVHHFDRAANEALIRRAADAAHAAGARFKLIATDGVFSMDGDIAPLAGICDVAERYEAAVMVDDAHASGVLGRNGRGTVDHFGLHGRVDIQVGTLSKAIGALGGYVAGSQALIDFLHHRARPFLFSTSHPPAVAAACLAAIDVLENEPELIARLWDNTRFFKSGLQTLGFNTGVSESPITPVIVGEAALAMKLSDALFQEGVFAQGIGFPTVARDRARVRTIVTATHTRDELQFALDCFGRVGRSLGVI